MGDRPKIQAKAVSRDRWSRSRWMDGWLNKWMNEWINEWTNESLTPLADTRALWCRNRANSVIIAWSSFTWIFVYFNCFLLPFISIQSSSNCAYVWIEVYTDLWMHWNVFDICSSFEGPIGWKIMFFFKLTATKLSQNRQFFTIEFHYEILPQFHPSCRMLQKLTGFIYRYIWLICMYLGSWDIIWWISNHGKKILPRSAVCAMISITQKVCVYQGWGWFTSYCHGVPHSIVTIRKLYE